jgi:hypothetical protein
VEKTPLPAVDDPVIEVIEFCVDPPDSDEKVKAECMLSERQLALAVDYRIPERINHYEDCIKACRDQYKTRKQLDKYGRIEFHRNSVNPGLKVTPGTFDRACRLMHGLITLCEKIGWDYSPEQLWRGGGETYAFSHSGETLFIQIKEPVNQIKHERDPKDSLRNYWRYEYEYRPTGRLELIIESLSSSGLKHRWSDKDEVLIEAQLLSIVQAMSRGFEYRRIQTTERERQQKEWELERARIEEQRRREKVENQRREHLFELASDYTKVEDIRRFVDAVRSSSGDAEVSSQLKAWLQWAESVAMELDPVLNKDKIVEQHESIGSPP